MFAFWTLCTRPFYFSIYVGLLDRPDSRILPVPLPWSSTSREWTAAQVFVVSLRLDSAEAERRQASHAPLPL